MTTTYDDFDTFAHAVVDHQTAQKVWVRLNGKKTTGEQDASYKKYKYLCVYAPRQKRGSAHAH